MAYKIISPRFSFVRFDDNQVSGPSWLDRQQAGAQLGFSLPVYQPKDLQFQFIINGTAAEITAICNYGPTSLLVNLLVGIYWGKPTTVIPNYYLAPTVVPKYSAATNPDMVPQMLQLDTNNILFQITLPDAFFAGDFTGSCFQIILYYVNQAAPVIPQVLAGGISNSFKIVNDTAHTTLFAYYSDEDEAGFYYCLSPALKNIVRLPLYLVAPEYAEEESIYRRSDGHGLITKSEVREVFDVVTTDLPRWAVQALRAIFQHDNIAITSLIFTGDIVKEGDFTVDYGPYKTYPMGTVTMKVAADELLLEKNNCAECEPADAFVVPATVQAPGNAPGVPYYINLVTLPSYACCAPLTFTILSYATSIDTISIDASNVVHYQMKANLGIYDHTNFIVVEAVCGGIPKTITFFVP